MNKKGFTLVELLAVVAILAILVVFAVPNVIKMFEKAKKENFLNEVKTIYNEAGKKYISEQLKGNNIDRICTKDGNKLDINASDNLEYCIELDNGNVTNIAVSNGKYTMYSTAEELKDKNIMEWNISDIPEEYVNINSISWVKFPKIEQNATGPVLSTLFNASDTANFGVYTGEHNDTYGIEGNEPIIYFKTNKNNNVIFADHCWQMIRTTSSGGVRLLYNGKQVNNKCEDRGNNNLGYSGETTMTLDSSYYYADDYDFDGTNFLLVAPVQATWSDSTKDNLIGKYVCKITNNICNGNLYLVSRDKSNTQGYVIPIIKTSHYSQFGVLQFNYSYNSPTYVGYKYGKVYTYKTIESNVTGEFSSGVAYSSETYTLTGTTSETVTNNTHYFCSSFENSNCKKVGYVYFKSGTTLYYLELNGESNIDEVLANMLDNNTNDSTMKTGLEAWYKKHLSDSKYNKYIEQDAIYCNRRERKKTNNQYIDGFNPNGGSIGGAWLYFVDSSSNSDLSCSDEKDQFSKNNQNATLKYPIGLMTLPEASIANSAIRTDSEGYSWLASACRSNSGNAVGRDVSSSGVLGTVSVDGAYGVRPIISIRPDVKVVESGEGTTTNPYVIN